MGVYDHGNESSEYLEKFRDKLLTCQLLNDSAVLNCVL